MTLPKSVTTALDADITSIVPWNFLLSYFSKHQNELTPPEKLTIYEKCEEFRNFWNNDYAYEKEIVKNGKVEKMMTVRLKLDIKQTDISPNAIYTDNDILETLQTNQTNLEISSDNKNNKPAKDSRRDNDLIEQGSALAI